MTKVLVYTQHRENYAVHDWDGKGEVPQYWKNKGGDIYILEGSIDDLEEVTPLIETSSDSFEEFVIHTKTIDEDAPAIKWDWENPWTIKRSEGRWIAERWVEAEYWWSGNFKGKWEFYAMLPNGGRTDYVCDYVEQPNG